MLTEMATKVVQNAVPMAVAVLVNRVEELPPEDKKDLFELAVVFLRNHEHGDQEEAESAATAMYEILAQEPVAIQRATVIENAAESVGHWANWVGSKIKELRLAADFTQDELAARAGLPQSHICRLEKGEHSPSFVTRQKLADALGVPVKELDPSAPEGPCGDVD